MTYILQRSIREGGKDLWFDDKRFDDRDKAVAVLKREQSFQTARIQGLGGSNWSGQRVQPMRVVKAVA